MKTNFFTMCALVALSLATSGCAFLINQGKQDVSIAAIPNNADIKNNGVFLGQGGANASLDRASSPNIVATAAGYEDAHIYPAGALT